MCRSIRVLRNPQAASPEEVKAAALQFVRKISGCRMPPRAHQAAFEAAVAEVAAASQRLLAEMGPPRVRRAPEEVSSTVSD